MRAVDLASQFGQIAQAREIAEIQLEAAKELVHRVVAADDDFDGGKIEAGLLCFRWWLGRRGV